MLVYTVPKYFDKLLKYCRLTTLASSGEFCGVMVVAVDFTVVFVIGILRSEDGWTDAAGEMLYVVFPFESCDIAPAQGATAGVA